MFERIYEHHAMKSGNATFNDLHKNAKKRRRTVGNVPIKNLYNV